MVQGSLHGFGNPSYNTPFDPAGKAEDESETFMKVPLSWLREYVDLPASVAQLAERLTLAGLEVAGVRAVGVPVPEGLGAKAGEAGPVWDRDKVVVARVLQTDRHPNADKLKLVTVEYGAAQPKVVVTGAPNIQFGAKGQKVVLGLAGTTYWDGHVTPKALQQLKASTLRGVPSDAMVMSEYELGISEEHEGIIILDEDAPEPGTPAAEFMGDVVLDLDVLPNMARCLSMIGVAREVSALTGKPLRLPPHAARTGNESIEGLVKVVIEDPKLSARYAALLLRNVKVGPSPGWLQRRLTYAGMRPINNLVDVTNYVMLEWGQPLHAFDYDKLAARAGGAAPTIIVRPARKGEVLRTLDENNKDAPLALTPYTLIIADTAGPIAVAGVKGGDETKVTEESRNILLESANFDFVSVRRTMRALNIPSEASLRFSKGIHPETVRPAAERAAELMRVHAGCTVCKGIAEAYPAPLPPLEVLLDMSEVRRCLGVDFPQDEAARILRALEFRVEPAGGSLLRVTAPPHRVDIQEGPADLIEELARVHGYDRLPATLLCDQLPEQHTNRPLVLEERVRDLLVNSGLQEVMTYALTEPAREAALVPAETEYVRLLNPISSERVVMRHSVLASVLEVAAANLRHTDGVRLFEIGHVYLPKAGAALPDEPRRLAVVMTGPRPVEYWGESRPAGAATDPLDFYDLKGIIEALADDLHLQDVTYQRAQAPHLHPGCAAELVVKGQLVGTFGELHPRLRQRYETAEGYKLGTHAVLAAEFDLDALLAHVPDRYTYTPVPRFPPALRDVAVIVDEDVPADLVLAEIRAAGDLLADARLFDVYRGDSIAAGKKSLAYALTYQAPDRTLAEKEIDKAHKKVEDRLKQVLKAQIRGQDA